MNAIRITPLIWVNKVYSQPKVYNTKVLLLVSFKF